MQAASRRELCVQNIAESGVCCCMSRGELVKASDTRVSCSSFELLRLANRQGAGLQRVRAPIFDGSYIGIMETKIGDYYFIGL